MKRTYTYLKDVADDQVLRQVETKNREFAQELKAIADEPKDRWLLDLLATHTRRQ